MQYSNASEYHKLYDRALWKRLRAQQLMANPLCAFCLARGIVTEATIADHIKPHKGDESLFFDNNNLQSLCKECHDSDKQALERTGKRLVHIGLDGWPIGTEAS